MNYESNKPNNSRSRKEILSASSRCIYCRQAPTTVEHMPPRSMFREKQRPNEMAFACCQKCNNGTSDADLIASFVARLSKESNPDDPLIKEALGLKRNADRKLPGVLDAFLGAKQRTDVWIKNDAGIALPYAKIDASRAPSKPYMNAFGLKLGMALFARHIGEPLPHNGGVLAQVYLNAGLATEDAERMLKIMPNTDTLRQGKMNVLDQFIYRFNSDYKTIIISLSDFHRNLFILNIATTRPDIYLKRIDFGVQCRPGELANWVPSRPRLTNRPLPLI